MLAKFSDNYVCVICIVLFFIASSVRLVWAQEAPSSIADLAKQIENVVEEMRLPSASVAVVQGQETLLLRAFGFADIEKKQLATTDTLYRIGSTSKMFVGLAILKLVEEGKLSLDDTVKSLVPELEFENQWEDSHPIRIVHLLEHTTGWDDLHLPEYAHNQNQAIDLASALKFHPHSRISRWVPGTRMAYCNSGPAVAALIVEKTTGRQFEEYIQTEFFDRIGLSSATYYRDQNYLEHGVTLYNSKRKPDAYWNIIFRPSGSINASAKDMAQLLKFFISRGKVNNENILSLESIERMERPENHLGAREGLELGFGLYNYSSAYKNWHYREHNGSVNTGLSAFAYMPKIEAGYTVLINSGDVRGLNAIVALIRAFQTKDLTDPVVEKEMELTEDHRKLAGYYAAINPRIKMSEAFVRLVSVYKVSFETDKMIIKPLLGDWTAKHYPISPTLFKSDYSGAKHLAVVEDPLAGTVLHMESAVLQPISAFWVYLRFAILLVWSILIFSSLVYFVVWFLLRLKKHPASKIPWQVHTWPLCASISILMAFLFNLMAMSNPIKNLSHPGFYSVGLMLSTLLFALFGFMAVIALIRYWKPKLLYGYFALVAVMHAAVIFYLARFGLIGIQTWA